MRVPSRNLSLFLLAAVNIFLACVVHSRNKTGAVYLSSEVNRQIDAAVSDRLYRWSSEADRVLSNVVYRSANRFSDDSALVPSKPVLAGRLSFDVYAVGGRFYLYDGRYTYGVGDSIYEGTIEYINPRYCVADGRQYSLVPISGVSTNGI